MRGLKTGGRVQGTKNKRTDTIIEKLAELKCDPIEGMALIAMAPETEIDLRARMFAELAQYVAPKLKSVEKTANIDVNVRHILEAVSDEQWAVEYSPKRITNGNGSDPH